MKRKSKLLNVVSIIIIVFSSLGILGTLAGIAMSGMLEPYYETYGITPPSAGSYAFALILAVIELTAGIMGVMYRSKKSVLIMRCLLYRCSGQYHYIYGHDRIYVYLCT